METQGIIEPLSFFRKQTMNSLKMLKFKSFLARRNITLYKAQSEAPAVTTGILQITHIILVITIMAHFFLKLSVTLNPPKIPKCILLL